MSFRTSLSGLDAASTDLSVVGNNIANASTTGFKESRAEFVDVFATTFSGVSGNTPGSGVRVSKIAQQFGQGNIEFTASNLDMAVNGEGFFIVSDDGTESYTRSGAFTTDREGFVVDSSGRELQVFPANSNDTFNTGTLTSLQLTTTDSAPRATTSVSPIINLNANEATPANAFDPVDADTYNHSTSTTVYDSLGNGFPATMYYVASDPTNNEWQAYTIVDGNTLQMTDAAGPTTVDFFTLTFNGDGSIASTTIGADAPDTTSQVDFDAFSLGNGAIDLDLNFDYAEITQYGGDFSIYSLNQDGFSSGRLSGIDIDQNGAVFARFTNGQSDLLGQVALASFPNIGGLNQLGSTSWGETFSSGDRIIGSPSSSGFGALQSGALEASNVDIASQLVSLITSQRNFQANAKAISTEDTIQQAILNI
jgi:flagellar hook protein FlgE